MYKTKIKKLLFLYIVYNLFENEKQTSKRSLAIASQDITLLGKNLTTYVKDQYTEDHKIR